MKKIWFLGILFSLVLFIFPFAYADLFTEYQTISKDYIWNFEYFKINSESYLAASNSSGNIKVYKWNGKQFTEFQTIFIDYSYYNLESIIIGSDIYLAAASIDINFDSQIYRWDGIEFKEFQTIPTNGAYGLESFTIRDDIYLAVAGVNNSKLYKWTATHFAEESQGFPSTATSVYDFEFFNIDSDFYLAIANNDGDSKIYRWIGTQFIAFQTIIIDEYGYSGCESFSIGSEKYLACISDEINTDLRIYKWNGFKFKEFQTISTNETYYDLKSFQIGQDVYLAIAHYMYEECYSDSNSKIYKWDATKFIEFQTIQACTSFDLEPFIIDSNLYIAVSDMYFSKIYKANIEEPNINGITLYPSTGDAPLSVDFSAILIGGTSPYTYSWDFDSDGVEDSSLESPSYTYNIAGSYNITVTVTDANSKVATQNTSIVVTHSDPATNLTAEDCYATYDFINNQFIVPCYELNGILYKVNMTLNSYDPYFLFKLDSIVPQ